MACLLNLCTYDCLLTNSASILLHGKICIALLLGHWPYFSNVRPMTKKKCYANFSKKEKIVFKNRPLNSMFTNVLSLGYLLPIHLLYSHVCFLLVSVHNKGKARRIFGYPDISYFAKFLELFDEIPSRGFNSQICHMNSEFVLTGTSTWASAGASTVWSRPSSTHSVVLTGIRQENNLIDIFCTCWNSHTICNLINTTIHC